VTGTVSPEFLSLQEVLAGRYSLERELGRGGMGIVLLARDVALDRLVAIKLLPPELAEEPELRERFLREARTAAGLSHPNIVPIHAVEEHGKLVFFVMGYVDGETLRQRVGSTGPLSPRAAMTLIQEVAWALGYAHSRGIVHRDIKPENILIDRATSRALVTDFGIAQVAKSRSDPPEGELVGTARYMSPEQAAGELVDARSDLYSLGVTAFFALTARTPFDAANVPALLMKHITEPAPAVATVRQDMPEKLAAIVDRCLQKEPSARFATGDDVAEAVGEARGRELRAPPIVRNFLRNAQVTTAVFLTAAVVAGGGDVDRGAMNAVLVLVVVQLGAVARRLLKEGYTFDDIRQALLAEARAQDEEAEAVGEKKWIRRIYGLWHRLWAGKFGRTFFRLAGTGLRSPKRLALPSADATELVLGRATVSVFEALPAEDRTQLSQAPEVIHRLERHAAKLREKGDTGENLTAAVAALENIRLGMLRLQVGGRSVHDLTMDLARAREVSDQIAAVLESRE
jgi:serine/threonine-protein kinase